jgi:hypothetical protein
MSKKKFITMQQYSVLLGGHIETIEEAGNHVAPYFEKLDEAIKSDGISKLSDQEFVEIATEFENTVEVYQDVVGKLNGMSAPVRFIGAHKNIQQMMADSLDTKTKQVDLTAFTQSEKDQDIYLDKFFAQVRRIFTMGTK